MTNPASSIIGCIDRLIASYPPTAVAIVGVGTGHSPWVQAFMARPIPKAVLIDSDEGTLQHLKQTIAGKSDWICSHQLVAAKTGPAELHHSSISMENGLFPSSLLQDAWPNIREQSSATVQAKTIAQVLAELCLPANWLWIDCLPALAVIGGAGPDYSGFDVICVRVLREESQDVRSREAALFYVKLVIEAEGFQMLAYEPERNPMIGHALFVRAAQQDSDMPPPSERYQELSMLGADTLPEIAGFDIGSPPAGIVTAIKNALSSDDLPQTVSSAVHHAGYTPRECYHFLMGVARATFESGDKMYGAGLLNEASHLLDKLPLGFKWDLVKVAMQHGLADDAYEILISHIARESPLSAVDKAKIAQINLRWKEKILGSKGHGHEVLIAFIKRHAELYRESAGEGKPVVIEVGTTRENASGQGSTRRLMEICSAESFHFITVDMDSANTEMAAAMFEKNGLPFEAVHSKGEDYLANYQGRMDCVFLDAYDFDHGMHSERRQSRYEKYLGSRIDEQKCHEMHLECARHVADRLSEYGVVCVDDTWLDDGKWTAKGTLAAPFLFDCGMVILDARNKSLLVGRESLIHL